MDAVTVHPLEPIGQSEREEILATLAGEGPELGWLLVDLALRARGEGKTKLANMLYNSALFQEQARGRSASPVALECLAALMETDFKLDNRGEALMWAGRLARVAPDDKTKKMAERWRARIIKAMEDAGQVTSGGAPSMPGGSPTGFLGPVVTQFEASDPDVSFSDVGGLAAAKNALERVAILPHKDPESAERFGIDVGGGVLLYGPPGCGKTLLAEAAAGEMGVPIIRVKAADLLHPLYGMAERNIAAAFAAAREKAPCVLFIDEIDGIAQSRDADFLNRSMVTPLLAELEASGRKQGVLIIGATNLIERVDRAVLRPGRFDKLVLVDKPDPAARAAIWRLRLAKHPCAEDIDLELLVELSGGLTGAEIAEIALSAAESVWMQCTRDGVDRRIEMFDILASLRHRFVDGAVKNRIDELMGEDWRGKLE